VAKVTDEITILIVQEYINYEENNKYDFKCSFSCLTIVKFVCF